MHISPTKRPFKNQILLTLMHHFSILLVLIYYIYRSYVKKHPAARLCRAPLFSRVTEICSSGLQWDPAIAWAPRSWAKSRRRGNGMISWCFHGDLMGC
jgi:hypothetical protein